MLELFHTFSTVEYELQHQAEIIRVQLQFYLSEFDIQN